MAGFGNTKADVAYLNKRRNQNKAMGEKLLGSEYWVTFDGYPNISILVRTTQLPEQARQQVEDFIPGGMTITQHGALKNNGELSMQCVETIEGDVLKTVHDIVWNKKSVDIRIATSAESKGGEANGQTRLLSDCLVYSDAIDFGAEDMTTPVRPNLRVIYNWVEAV